MPEISYADVFSPWSGFVDLSNLIQDSHGIKERNSKQEYSLNLDHKLAPWVSLRGSVYYRRFDQDLDQSLGIYREEWRPGGEFRWDHPNFFVHAFGQRRKATFTGSQTTINDVYQVSGQSRWDNGPVFKISMASQDNRDELESQLNVENRSLSTSVDHSLGDNFLHYGFEFADMDNLISGVTSEIRGHQFRWNSSNLTSPESQFQAQANYSFGYRTQINRVTDQSTLLEFAHPLVGLYALNDNPEFGALEPLDGLIDGDFTNPTDPVVDIGGASTGQNLGADFGAPEDIAAIYIYTDRPSGSQLDWEVWGSIDNFNWSRIDDIQSQIFNTAVNRYEVHIDLARFRYLKAVNSAVNEIAQVYITEMRFLRPVPDAGEETENSLYSSSHRISGRIGTRSNSAWNTNINLNGQLKENHGRSGDRYHFGLGWDLGYEQNRHLNHSFRIDATSQNEDSGYRLNREAGANYSLEWKPNPHFRNSFSLSNSFAWEQEKKTQDFRAGHISGAAQFTRGVSLTWGIVGSESAEVEGFTPQKSWSFRSGLATQPLKALKIDFGGRYQETYEQDLGLVNARTSTSVRLNWSVTDKLFVRGSSQMNKDRSRRYIYDFLLSWKIRNNFRISVQHYELTDQGYTTTLRRRANLNWELTRSARYYFRVSQVDLSGSGGTRVVSYQQGFRVSF